MFGRNIWQTQKLQSLAQIVALDFFHPFILYGNNMTDIYQRVWESDENHFSVSLPTIPVVGKIQKLTFFWTSR